MRARSSAAARQHRQRIDRLRRTTHGPTRCQWPEGCASEAVDAHESQNRSQGGDPTDPDWLLCRHHHDRVTAATGQFRTWCIVAGLIRLRQVPTVGASCTVPHVAKRPLTIRVPESADAWVQDVMNATGARQSTVLRAMLSIATQHRSAVLARVEHLSADD